MGNRFSLKVVKVRASFPWAIRAIMDGKVRYRGYRYKAEAIKNMDTWVDCEDWCFPREFYHNFNSAEELGIIEEIT